MSAMTSCMHKASRLPSAIVKAHSLDLQDPFFWLLYLSLSKIDSQQFYFDTRHQTWAVVNPRSARKCQMKRAEMTGTGITTTALGARIVCSIYPILPYMIETDAVLGQNCTDCTSKPQRLLPFRHSILFHTHPLCLKTMNVNSNMITRYSHYTQTVHRAGTALDVSRTLRATTASTTRVRSGSFILFFSQAVLVSALHIILSANYGTISDCTNCRNCTRCVDTTNSSNSTDCDSCDKCQNCTDCGDCTGCHNCTDCSDCIK
jgi:hypothetical protein